MAEQRDSYGVGDASFQAAGGEAGIRALVEDFYRVMDTRSDAREIRAMHPRVLTVSIDKLARFLCGWLGGPKRFQQKYGPISIPGVHLHLAIRTEHRDAWLGCMQQAIAKQDFAEDFKEYLLVQLATPADRILRACQANGRPGSPNEGRGQ
jgi:hemoglobin